MAIFHADHHNGNFTQLQNEIIHDNRLNPTAYMVLSYLLSKPAHWRIIPNQLIAVFKPRGVGRDAVYNALRKLRETGYVVRRARRVEGQYQGYDYDVYEMPQTPVAGASAAFPPETEMAKPDALSNTDTPRNTKKTYCASSDAPCADDVELTTPTPPPEPTSAPEPERSPEPTLEQAFAVFYEAGLPKKSRKRAFAAFRRAVRGQRDPVAFAERLATDVRSRLGRQYGFQNLYPENYLKHERWTDDLTATTTPKPAAPRIIATVHASHRPARSIEPGRRLNIVQASIERGQGLAQTMGEQFSGDPRDCLAQMRAMVGSA